MEFLKVLTAKPVVQGILQNSVTVIIAGKKTEFTESKKKKGQFLKSFFLLGQCTVNNYSPLCIGTL